MRRLRCMVARWLRRLADRIAPQRDLRIHVIGDATKFEQSVAQAQKNLRRLARQQAPAGHAPGWSRDVTTTYTPPPHGYQGP